MRSLLLCLAAPVLLSACSGLLTEDLGLSSGFATPTSNGNFNAGLSQTTVPDGLIDGDGDGFAFQAGVQGGSGLRAISGLLPGTDTAAWPTTGTATYTGDYLLIEIVDIFTIPGQIEGTPYTLGGPMSLSTNFANNSVVGSSSDGLLTINGSVNNGDLNGSVTFDRVTGALDGVAGSDQIIGVYHGTSDQLVYAGGFIADRD